MRIQCNWTEWDHLNKIRFGCDVTLFWQCHRFHRSHCDTDVDGAQFDRVGPFERDWVWLRCHSFFGNGTVSIVANETQMRIECKLTEWDHLNETGFGCDVMSLSFGNATVSIVANETQMWIERNLTEWDHLNETGFGCDVTLCWKCHRFHRSQCDTDEDRV